MQFASKKLEQNLIQVAVTVIGVTLVVVGFFLYVSFASLSQDIKLISLVSDEAKAYPENIPLAQEVVDAHKRKKATIEVDFSKVHNAFYVPFVAPEQLVTDVEPDAPAVE